MTFAVWALFAGAVFTVMALSGTLLKRLPLSTAMLYLAAGFALGPAGLGWLSLSPIDDYRTLEIVTEAALLISLFAVGLNLSVPLKSHRWRAPVRLATVSMVITIALLAVISVFVFDLPLGAAILLAAILAPTDPVLASDVQLTDAEDRDSVRVGLTAEGGLNDGAAFPFVMLGLGVLGLHELGPAGVRWIAIDLIWAVFGGLAIGWACGWAIGKLVIYLRTRHREAVGLDEFLMLGLIGIAYGVTVLASAYGFLAVFAAGLALARTSAPGQAAKSAVAEVVDKDAKEQGATDPERAAPYMTRAIRDFNEQLERIVEVAIVIIVGAMLTAIVWTPMLIVFALLLFVVVRPVSVAIGLAGLKMPTDQRWLIGWFGIRGIGSIYYLAYVIGHGLPQTMAQVMTSVALVTVAASIVLHGISVTPLMNLYSKRRGKPSA